MTRTPLTRAEYDAIYLKAGMGFAPGMPPSWVPTASSAAPPSAAPPSAARCYCGISSFGNIVCETHAAAKKTP